MFLDLNNQNCLCCYSHFFRNELAKLATYGEYVLVTKVDILVAMATILVAICSHGIVMTWAFRNTDDFLLTFAQGLWPMYCSR